MAIIPASSAYVQPRAAWRVTLDGRDLTRTMAPILISLRLTEARGEEADQLEIELDDSKGNVAIPPEGALLRVALGWERGSGVAAGLADKGTFKVDEVSWSGPADRIRISARSADLTREFRTRRNRTWKDTTIGAIVDEIAGQNGLIARCHGQLAGRAIAAAEQGNKSDMQFLRDLARRHDASATAKAGCLIFAPIGAATTATGAALPGATIRRTQCSRAEWRRAARENAQDGAEAQWHDTDSAQRRTVSTGGSNPRRLKRVYADEADASHAAEAEATRLRRAAASLSVTLALGDARLTPGMRITATGFKDAIDGTEWLIASTEHTMDGSGLKSRIEMEVAS